MPMYVLFGTERLADTQRVVGSLETTNANLAFHNHDGLPCTVDWSRASATPRRSAPSPIACAV
jgi:hypothetical protein